MRTLLATILTALAAGPNPAPQQPIELPGLVLTDPTGAERARNLELFEREYLARKETLFDAHAGHWLAIAHGRFVPADARGEPQPVAELASLVEQLAALEPAPLQRFVWRIGEEGLVRFHFTLCERPVFAGHALFVQMGGVWITTDGVYQGERGAEFSNAMTRLGSGADPVLDLGLATPDGARSRNAQAWAANLYGGSLVLDAAHARELALELWEIPGTAEMIGVRQMRRARLRVSVPAAKFERLLPVAVRD